MFFFFLFLHENQYPQILLELPQNRFTGITENWFCFENNENIDI